jgi:hypothetical protein
VAKRKSSKKKGAASPTRRTAASRSRGARAKGRPAERKIQLKPIRVLIAGTIERLQRLPPTDAIKLTIERLQRCQMELDDICNPANNDGCAPTMEFPR